MTLKIKQFDYKATKWGQKLKPPSPTSADVPPNRVKPAALQNNNDDQAAKHSIAAKRDVTCLDLAGEANRCTETVPSKLLDNALGQENVSDEDSCDDSSLQSLFASSRQTSPTVPIKMEVVEPSPIITDTTEGQSKDAPIILDEEVERPTSPPAEISAQKVSKCGRRRSECDGDVATSDDGSSAQSASHDNITEAALEAKPRRSFQKNYPVKVISGSKIVQTKNGLRLMYMVEWETSWEPSENLECDDLVAEFHKKNPKAVSAADLTRVAKRKMGVPEDRRKKRKMQSASQRSLGLDEIHGAKKQLLDLPTELLGLIWDFIFHDTLAMHPEKTKVFGWRLVCREFNAILLRLAYRALTDGPKLIDPRSCSCVKHWIYEGSLAPLRNDALMGIDITPWKNIAYAELWRKRCDCKLLDQLLIPNLPNKLVVRILLNGLDLAPPNSLTTVIRRVDEKSRFGLLYLSVLTLGRVGAVLYFTRAREQTLSPRVEKHFPSVLSAYQGKPCRAETSDPIFGSTSRAAIVGGHIDTATGLLHRGYPTKPDWTGRTLVHWAAIRGFCQVIEMVSTSTRDLRGRTPLSYTAKRRRAWVVEQISIMLSDVRFTDSRGRTALHYAAKEGHQEVLKYLLAHKPSIVIRRDHAGMIAEQLAAREGHKDAENLLRDARMGGV